MKTPHFIYFDLGNVLLTFDHAIACRRVAASTGLAEHEIHATIFESGLQLRYESGEIDSQEFVAAFVTATGCSVDVSDFLEMCSDVFELNTPIVPIVAHLRTAGFRLGVLSNTCQAHWEFVSRGRYTILHELFEREVLSYECKAMKPYPTIYETAITAADVEPDRIFFVDDRSENVAGACLAGLDAALFRGVQPLLHDLRMRRVLTNL